MTISPRLAPAASGSKPPPLDSLSPSPSPTHAQQQLSPRRSERYPAAAPKSAVLPRFPNNSDTSLGTDPSSHRCASPSPTYGYPSPRTHLVRRMSSVPELRVQQRSASPCLYSSATAGRQRKDSSGSVTSTAHRSHVERGRQQPGGRRPSNGVKLQGQRNGERQDRQRVGGNTGSGAAIRAYPSPQRPLPPGLQMPLAFNSIAREKGYPAGSHGFAAAGSSSRQRAMLPSSSGTSATEFIGEENHSNRPDLRDPPRSSPYVPYSPPQAPYSQASSVTSSPHSSIGPFCSADEIRSSFRSALSEVNRSSNFSSSSETGTDSRNSMTVDEAIGMYASDTDEDEISEPLDTKGDFSRSTSRNGSFADSEFPRRKGDSVLGGEVSPETRSRIVEQEYALEREISHQQLDMKTGLEEAFWKEEPETTQDVPECRAPADELSPRLSDDFMPTSPDEPGTVELIESKAAQINAEARNLEGLRASPTPGETACPPPEEFTRRVLDKSTTVARDRYGFKKKTQHVSQDAYELWEAQYNGTLERRRRKWDQLLRESGLNYGEEGPMRFPPKSAKIKRYIRKGIPPEWRGAAWWWYAGGQRYLTKFAGVYTDLVEKGQGSADAEIIERDLHRTFPDNIQFKPDLAPGDPRISKQQEKQFETAIVKKLRRVLQAFSVYVPKVGYCQSLNFLAGLLLLFLEEEKAFWMLYIMTHIHLPGSHEVNLHGSSADQWVLMMSVRELLPGVWAKIGGGLDGGETELSSRTLPPVTLCTSPWFMSGFIGTLPIESVLRVWDCLFYEGSKTLFRIALTIFKLGEAEIRAVNDPMEVFQVVQSIPRKLVDAGALIEACYRRRNGFGHLSQETIDVRRKERRLMIADERAAIQLGGARASRDDMGLRLDLGRVHHHGELGRKFKKILVKV